MRKSATLCSCTGMYKYIVCDSEEHQVLMSSCIFFCVFFFRFYWGRNMATVHSLQTFWPQNLKISTLVCIIMIMVVQKQTTNAIKRQKFQIKVLIHWSFWQKQLPCQKSGPPRFLIFTDQAGFFTDVLIFFLS